MRAAAMVASQPACPAPTTTTSYCSVKLIFTYILQVNFHHRDPIRLARRGGLAQRRLRQGGAGSRDLPGSPRPIRILVLSCTSQFSTRPLEDHHRYLSRL